LKLNLQILTKSVLGKSENKKVTSVVQTLKVQQNIFKNVLIVQNKPMSEFWDIQFNYEVMETFY